MRTINTQSVVHVITTRFVAICFVSVIFYFGGFMWFILVASKVILKDAGELTGNE